MCESTRQIDLATDDFVQEILKQVTLYTPIRSIVKIRTTSQRTVKYPKRTGQFSAQWVAEQGSRTETAGLAYGMWEIPTHEVYALVDISQQDLEDSAFNLESELQSEFAEQFAVAEGTACVTGNGVGKPYGFMSDADVGHVPGGHATLLNSGDALVDAFYELKTAYANNATWTMNRKTLGVIRKLKDGQGRYIWEPSVQVGQPPTILNRPYVEAPDMVDIAAGADPIAIGDFKKAYLLADRVELAIQRDPYTQVTSGNVRFIARKRLGGQIVMAEAIKKLRIEAS